MSNFVTTVKMEFSHFVNHPDFRPQRHYISLSSALYSFRFSMHKTTKQRTEEGERREKSRISIILIYYIFFRKDLTV
jgi:hypothetical protein